MGLNVIVHVARPELQIELLLPGPNRHQRGQQSRHEDSETGRLAEHDSGRIPYACQALMMASLRVKSQCYALFVDESDDGISYTSSMTMLPAALFLTNLSLRFYVATEDHFSHLFYFSQASMSA